MLKPFDLPMFLAGSDIHFLQNVTFAGVVCNAADGRSGIWLPACAPLSQWGCMRPWRNWQARRCNRCACLWRCWAKMPGRWTSR